MAVSAQPEAGVKNIRLHKKATYARLYRKDRIWLRKNTPLKKIKIVNRNRVNWTERDLTTSNAVSIAADELKNQPGYPKWRTRAALIHQSKFNNVIEKHIDRLPRTAQVLSELAETRIEFAVRRVQFVIEQYVINGYHPKRWELVRAANVNRLLDNSEIQIALEQAIRRIFQADID